MKRLSRRNVIGLVAAPAGFLVFVGVSRGLFTRKFGLVAFFAMVAVGGWWIWDQWATMRHAHQIERFARENGWGYAEVGGLSLTRGSAFPFGEGVERRAVDVIEGMYGGAQCSSFLYLFNYTGGDDRSADQVFTVTQASLPVPFPRLDLIPEDAGSRILGAITGNDIDLESAEFNRTWRVICADRKYAVDVVDPRMMQLLLSHRIPGVAIRVEGERVMAWSAGQARVADLRRRLDLVVGIANRLPAHVLRKHTEADAQRRASLDEREANAPTWAKTFGVLNSRRYTGIGVDADGDGVEDWEQRSR